MIDLSTKAVHVLNLYVWEALKNNTSMVVSDYGGKIPIIPGGQDPDFNNLDKPYLVYGFSEDPSSETGATGGGTVVYAIYSSSVADINKIINVITSNFEEMEAARRVNAWSSKFQFTPIDPFNPFPLIGMRFTDIRIAFGEGPSSADQEGGRENGTLTLKYDFVAKYSVKKYNPLNNTWS